MTRRTFLRVIGSAAVGAAVVASLPSLGSVAETVPSFPLWGTGTTGPLTYETLEQAYQSACLGSHHPTLGICSASVARQIGLVYDVDLEDAA